MTIAGRSAIAAGTRIGPYEVLGWLGAGAMGDVYRARDARLSREVAIKLIPDTLAGDPSRVQRFEQEARAAGQLNHPNILAVYDVGVHAGAPYIVSELLEGESLRARLSGGALTPHKAIDYARQIAEGLAAAHDKGIVHRDVKPDNLFITNDGRLKILDFGIAKLAAASDAPIGRTALPTETEKGAVMGTAGYMSPEQVRGEVVDGRSDLFSVGATLHEMLTGRSAFARPTAAETMTAILREEPPPLPGASAALVRIVSRCLEKTREMRFQSARDLAFGLEVLTDTSAGAATASIAPSPRRSRTAPAIALAAAALLIAGVLWLRNAAAPASFDARFTNATFTPFTNFEGSELDASISPDGKFVAFMADRDGPFHVWLKQVGTGAFVDLTPGAEDQRNVGPNRGVGFTGDGAEIWLNGTAGRRFSIMPLMGGARRPFLSDHTVNAAWSPDGLRLVHFTYDAGDAMIVADADGGNGRQILISADGDHSHFPVWSTDGKWIYYTHAIQAVFTFDVWRIPPSGGTPERLTELNSDIRYLTPIDARTILFVAPAEDRSGPWLWSLDVERRVTRRVSTGLEQYLSVSATADGRRIVASVAKAAAGLWSVPILDRVADERDVTPFRVSTTRALAPRFGSDSSLFYLSSNGSGDGLWRLADGKSAEIWKGSDAPLVETPSVSARGDRVALVMKDRGKLRLTLLSADGADRRPVTDNIEIRGTAAWSPDAQWVAIGGSDAQGPGLFKIPVDGGRPQRLVTGVATDPVWSPDGQMIVYAGRQTASSPLLAVRPDGSPLKFPTVTIQSGGSGRARFLPNGKGLVYLKSPSTNQDLWLLDLETRESRQITRLTSSAAMSTFDVAPDGRHILFDRLRDNADLRLIDLPK